MKKSLLTYRLLHLQRYFLTQHFTGLAHQPQIMITTNAFLNGHKCTGTYGNLFKQQPKHSCFIYLIKHSYIKHFRTFLKLPDNCYQRNKNLFLQYLHTVLMPSYTPEKFLGNFQRYIIHFIFFHTKVNMQPNEF